MAELVLRNLVIPTKVNLGKKSNPVLTTKKQITMAQQTAVEWLIKEFNLESYEASVKFALEKEKQQIEEAYLNGCIRVTPYGYYNDSAEKYYNKTYNK